MEFICKIFYTIGDILDLFLSVAFIYLVFLYYFNYKKYKY